jgi:hypothetical protein
VAASPGLPTRDAPTRSTHSNHAGHIKQKPGTVSRPGTRSEFRFRESTESGCLVKSLIIPSKPGDCESAVRSSNLPWRATIRQSTLGQRQPGRWYAFARFGEALPVV